MPLAQTDYKYRLATTAGSAGNSLTQADPNASLGKYISTTDLVESPALHALFDLLTGPRNTGSAVDYRCLFILNDHATATAYTLRVWIASQVSGGATLAIGLDPAGNVAKGSASAQAAEPANAATAPSGVTFSAPSDYAGGLAIGDLAPGYCRAVWIRRTAANSAALDADGATLGVQADAAE